MKERNIIRDIIPLVFSFSFLAGGIVLFAQGDFFEGMVLLGISYFINKKETCLH